MPGPKKNRIRVKAETRDYDVVIVGGGLAGASLAVALGNTAYRVAVIEAFELDSNAQPSYDERTIALTYSAKHIFSQLGVWDDSIETEACALKSIHISNKGHFGKTRLTHEDAGTEALGYVIPTRALGQALMHKLANTKNIDLFCPYEAKKIDAGNSSASITIAKNPARPSDTAKTSSLNARLVVIADGGRSPLLNATGISSKSEAYLQSALLSIVKTNIPHQHRAYERFVENGPLALLPMNGQRFAVVWTLSPEELETVSRMSDEHYLAHLQSTFGTRTGLFSAPTPRKAYPLSKSCLATPFSRRILALGNAAHTVHPVAGQGFNLGLRDVATLAEVLQQASASEAETDIGSEAFLQNYADLRAEDTRRVVRFTDGLLSIFNHPSTLVQLGRNIGLAAVENLPFVKRALLKRTMGLGRNQPRLARGLNISPPPSK
jgi:2-octaprenyl-6-methoxyphenol hydroxylase